MMGGSGETSYTITNMVLAIVGSFIMAIGLGLALFRQDYEPLEDPVPIPTRVKQQFPPAQESGPEEKVSELRAGPTLTPEMSTRIDDRLLVLRLLTGDERTVFRAVVDSGGEALQKDIIINTKMSDAKVSRTLDKLVEKGVVSKSRHGMTNKVKVEIEP